MRDRLLETAAGAPISRRFFVAGLGIALGRSLGLRAAEITASEPQAKAAFIFGFARYVEWPAHAFTETTSPIRICVRGDEEIAGELARIAEGKTIGGRAVAVHGQAPGGSDPCRVVFISGSQKSQSAQILRGVHGSPVLTVADFDSFLEAGGMIHLFTSGSRIRFDVNLTAAEQAGLALNAKLLALANQVRGRAKK